jgi:hypothetical protein
MHHLVSAVAALVVHEKLPLVADPVAPPVVAELAAQHAADLADLKLLLNN